MFPYAQRTRTDFLSLGAPRNSRSEGPIFSRTESAHTTDFLSQAAPRKNRTKSQRTRTDFLSELLCVTIAGEVQLLYDVTPKSAHMDRYFVVSSSKKRSERFYIGAKASTHEQIFTPIFCLGEKIGPCALGIITILSTRSHFYGKYCICYVYRLLFNFKIAFISRINDNINDLM